MIVALDAWSCVMWTMRDGLASSTSIVCAPASAFPASMMRTGAPYPPSRILLAVILHLGSQAAAEVEQGAPLKRVVVGITVAVAVAVEIARKMQRESRPEG